jgi:hypothetical protein
VIPRMAANTTTNGRSFSIQVASLTSAKNCVADTVFKTDDSWKYFESYADKLSTIEATYPNDLEAKVFEGLALILAQQPEDANLTELKEAVSLLQPLLLQYPDHPGIAHYLIHACDTPGLAQEGLEAARRYAKIAPAAPHALHMPSHIFTRLGLWQDRDAPIGHRTIGICGGHPLKYSLSLAVPEGMQ